MEESEDDGTGVAEVMILPGASLILPMPRAVFTIDSDLNPNTGLCILLINM